MKTKKIMIFALIIFLASSLFAKEKSILDGKVKCKIPDSPYILNYDHIKYHWDIDRSKIDAFLGAETNEDFIYRQEWIFPRPVEDIVLNDNRKIIKEHIYELLRSKKRNSIYFFNSSDLQYTYIKSSIKPFYYNGNIIGQKAMQTVRGSRYSFNYLSLAFYIHFVIDGALVCTGVIYDNPNDTSIMEAYPKLFKKVSDGEYAWKNEAAREKFYKIFESDDENKPIIMKELKATRDMILETLVIDE